MQKRLVALKGKVSGVLKPLASEEQVLVGEMTNIALSFSLVLNLYNITDVPAPNGQQPVPRLAHGLDRALFRQGARYYYLE
jgi:hypothetical protein